MQTVLVSVSSNILQVVFEYSKQRCTLEANALECGCSDLRTEVCSTQIYKVCSVLFKITVNRIIFSFIIGNNGKVIIE